MSLDLLSLAPKDGIPSFTVHCFQWLEQALSVAHQARAIVVEGTQIESQNEPKSIVRHLFLVASCYY